MGPDLLMGLALRHRLSALKDAAAEVSDRSSFLAAEARCVPLRPVVALAARKSGRSKAAEWQRIGGRAKYLQEHPLRRGGHVWIRHGTPDVFTLAEVLARQEYAIPGTARAALPTNPRIVDLGANIGMFALKATLELDPAKITAVEADPFNAEMLRRNAASAAGAVGWSVIEAFAATAAGDTVGFSAGEFAESRRGGGSTAVRTVDAFELMRDADLVKIDIEGSEWPILEDARLENTPARVMVLEYHSWSCPQAADPAGYCVELLERAGFTVAMTDPLRRDFGTAWAWRTG